MSGDEPLDVRRSTWSFITKRGVPRPHQGPPGAAATWARFIGLDNLGAGYAGLTSLAPAPARGGQAGLSLVRDIDKDDTKEF